MSLHSNYVILYINLKFRSIIFNNLVVPNTEQFHNVSLIMYIIVLSNLPFFAKLTLQNYHPY